MVLNYLNMITNAHTLQRASANESEREGYWVGRMYVQPLLAAEKDVLEQSSENVNLDQQVTDTSRST